MLYRPSSFRKTAFTLTTAAMLGVSAFAFPVNAQQAVAYTGSAACAQIGDSTQAIQCEYKQSQLRTKANNARGAAADARGAAADHELACMNMIMTDIQNNGRKTANLTAVPPKGQACKTARDLKLISG